MLWLKFQRHLARPARTTHLQPEEEVSPKMIVFVTRVIPASVVLTVRGVLPVKQASISLSSVTRSAGPALKVNTLLLKQPQHNLSALTVVRTLGQKKVAMIQPTVGVGQGITELAVSAHNALWGTTEMMELAHNAPHIHRR